MQEIWKDIKGYDGAYKVSNFGNIISLKRTKQLFLKKVINNNGYPFVCLSKKSKQKTYQIHQLVAIHFLNHDPCGLKIVVDHIDNNPLNNNINNLQLISNRKNATKDLFRRKMSSKFIGVYWHIRDKKWVARIKINGKKVFLGYFNDEKKASDAYQNKLKKIT